MNQPEIIECAIRKLIDAGLCDLVLVNKDGTKRHLGEDMSLDENRLQVRVYEKYDGGEEFSSDGHVLVEFDLNRPVHPARTSIVTAWGYPVKR